MVITVCFTTFLLQRPINSLKNYLKEFFTDQINNCKQNLKVTLFQQFSNKLLDLKKIWYHICLSKWSIKPICWLSFHSHGITLLLSEHFTWSKVVALGSVLDTAARFLNHHPDTPRHAARELGAQFRRHLLVPNPVNLGQGCIYCFGILISYQNFFLRPFLYSPLTNYHK